MTKTNENKLYKCYEENIEATKEGWKHLYNIDTTNGTIDKNEYTTFDIWWLDMRRSGVIEEI